MDDYPVTEEFRKQLLAILTNMLKRAAELPNVMLANLSERQAVSDAAERLDEHFLAYSHELHSAAMEEYLEKREPKRPKRPKRKPKK